MNNNTKHPIKDMATSNRFAYVLHLWHSTGQWRASLENLETGNRLGFANLEQLFAYLMDLIEGNFKKQPNTGTERIDEAKERK